MDRDLYEKRLVLRPDGFHDRYGRSVCLRGVNISSNAKLPPFTPFQEDCWWDLLASWGFNVVRLTIFWEAIEPEPYLYDRSYLEKISDMIDQASRRGIYVLLDMHQDLYSRYLFGDGAPHWALPSKVDPKNNDGYGGQFWGTAYTFSRDVRACFTYFFQSRDIRKHYLKAWQEVAVRVMGNPYLLGYDLMNEPSCGDISNLLGCFENEHLKPLYLDAIEAIRRVHPGAIGFVEPHALDTYTSKLTAFQTDGLVYAPHLYNPLSITLRLDPLPEEMLFNAMYHQHKRKARELSMPLLIGEFGAPWTMWPEYARNMAVDCAYQVLEGDFASCAYWDFSVKNVKAWNEEDFSIIDENGNPRGLEVNVRPYLRLLAGQFLSQSFDRFSKAYALSIRGPPGGPPSVIYVPESVQYPDGFTIDVSDGMIEYRRESSELAYFPERDGIHSIEVRPGR
ncbi:MAG TPA: cellulase family glycosylhydrolase [Methanotrichaceae archaeon]|nr:cellulase family glycosylhydrolase [Methanotrichaceae archaeon]